MTPPLSDLTLALLDAARKAGADSADALAVQGTSLSIEIRKGALEQAERSEGVEIGLRVLMGRRQACVSASDTSAATIQALAERAVAMAAEAPEDPNAGLADPDQLAQGWDLAALDLADPGDEPSAAQLEAQARAVEAAALQEGITQVEAAAGYGRRALHMAGTNGFAGGYGRTTTSLSAVAFTGQGTDMQR
ncbi:MAG TPA: DNA gyrase modulator, partial [Tabrizicola sp.]|nr:DNA gyrase modulator [Tabrizicola sp.]